MERRIYQKGWQIEWKKKIKSANVEDKKIKEELIESNNSKIETEIDTLDSMYSEESIVIFEKENNLDDNLLSPQPEKFNPNRQFVQNLIVAERKVGEKPKSKTSESNGIAIFFLVLGIVLAFSGISYAFLGNGMNASLLMRLFGFLILLFGVFLLMLGLIILWSKSPSAQTKKLDESEEKNTTGNTENEDGKKKKLSKLWEGRIIFLGFLLFVLIMFFLLV